MDTPNFAKTPLLALACVPIAAALHWVAGYVAACYVADRPVEPSAFVCSSVFIVLAFILAMILRETKICKLRTIAICMACGLLLGVALGGMFAAQNEIHNRGGRLPRNRPEIVADVVVGATVGMQVGILVGAAGGWLLTYQTSPKRRNGPSLSHALSDSGN